MSSLEDSSASLLIRRNHPVELLLNVKPYGCEMLLRIRLSILVVLLTACAPAAGQAPVHGTAQAKDGDALMVGGKEVRLYGIDAPEYDQSCQKTGQDWSCGAAAANRLAQLVNGKTVVCSSVGIDDHSRVLGRCMVGATDINRTMVATGYAVAFRRYSSDYVSAEESAKVNKRGIWSGTFQMPSEFRHTDAAPIPKAARRSRERAISVPRSVTSSGGCVIKGNQGGNGWIYHVPGMPYYEKTRAEQMFCTEAEARAAGYRRAIVK